jgi:hypothetical protein
MPRGTPANDFGRRPLGVGLLAGFFLAGTIMCFTAAVALLWPGGPLEPMWALNPRARGGFDAMGRWAIVLMGVVGAACGSAAAGLWKGRRWGRRLAIALLSVNVAGDLANAILARDARTLIGLPIAGALILYLVRNRRVRRYFGEPAAGETANAGP